MKDKNLKLDLQMFATASTQNQNATSASGMSAEMKTFYEKRLIDQAEPAWCMTSSATRIPFRPTAARTLSSASMTACPRPPLR